MEQTYIPASLEAQEQVNKLISKQRFITDLDQFILLYNEGVINVNNPEINDLAKLIAESYTNVTLQSRKLYVRSAKEAYVSKAIFVLESWKTALTLKRIAEDMIDDGLEVDTKLVFFMDKPGQVFVEDLADDGEINFKRYDSAEKFTNSKKAVVNNIIIKELISLYSADSEEIYFIKAYDLINLDTDLVDKVNDAIESTLSKEGE